MRVTEKEGSAKGRSENQNMAHVQSLCRAFEKPKRGLAATSKVTEGSYKEKNCNKKHQIDISKRQTHSIKHHFLFKCSKNSTFHGKTKMYTLENYANTA